MLDTELMILLPWAPCREGKEDRSGCHLNRIEVKCQTMSPLDSEDSATSPQLSAGRYQQLISPRLLHKGGLFFLAQLLVKTH